MRVRLPREVIFDLVGYKALTREVLAYHASPARLRIIDAPSRTSKSYSAAHDALYLALPDFEQTDKGMVPMGSTLTWLVGPDYQTDKEFDYIWDAVVEGPLKDLGRIESATNSPGQGHMRIVLNLGPDASGKAARAVFEGKSSTNQRALQGEEVSNVVLSEAAEHPETTWTRYLSTRYGRATLPTTPKIQAVWIQSMIQLAYERPDLGIAHFHFTPEANPRYDWERFWLEHGKAESRKLGAVAYTPPVPKGSFAANSHFCERLECGAFGDPYFAEQFLGLWTLHQERVIPFELHKHVLEKSPEWLGTGRWFWGFDYGQRDPWVGHLWCMGEDATFVLVDEFYETGLSDYDVLERVRTIEAKHAAKPEFYVGDPKRPEVERLLRRVGLPVYATDRNAMADRAAGRRLLVDLLSDDPRVGRSHLFVMSRCKDTIGEWARIHYRESGDELAPQAIVGPQHAYDAARYAMMAARRLRPKPHPDWYPEFVRRMERREIARRIQRPEPGMRGLVSRGL